MAAQTGTLDDGPGIVGTVFAPSNGAVKLWLSYMDLTVRAQQPHALLARSLQHPPHAISSQSLTTKQAWRCTRAQVDELLMMDPRALAAFCKYTSILGKAVMAKDVSANRTRVRLVAVWISGP